MHNTGFSFNGKPLAKLSLGCMRFPSREAAAEVVAECVKENILYLDTSPAYCYKSEEENCETWVGDAIQGFRDKVILSAKCSSGNGGTEIGEYTPSKGFSITTADQVRRQIEQSLRRLKVDKLDCYQLWAVHSPAVFEEALKPGGWLEGVLKAKEEGLFQHLGITGHGNSEEVKRWIDTGYFEMITIPFNIINASRLEVAKYAAEKGIAVIAMNPLSGGLLGSPSQVIADEMADLGVTSAFDMALRYCAAFPGFSALSGMTTAQEVRTNAEIVSKPLWSEEEAETVRKRFTALLGKAEHVCTQCKYCMPCPQKLNIPEILRLRNYRLLLQLDSAKTSFQNRYRQNDAFKADRCVKCGVCESRCPNSLPVAQLMEHVMEIMEI